MVAKVAGGIIGLGLIGTGGVAIAKPGWFGISKSPDWTPLSKDVTTGDPYKNKFGGKHKNYLVGIKEVNKDWWEESYKKLSQDNTVTGGAFQPNAKVKGGFSSPTTDPSTKTLKQVCEEAYKAEPTSVKATGASDSEFNEEHVWKYCSGLGSKPKTIKEAGETDTSGTARYSTQNDNTPIGKEAENELISVFDKGNDKFWEIREKEIRGGNNSKFEKITPSVTSSYFNTEGKTIKDLCKEAYEKNKTSSGGSSPTTEEVKKYCSLTIEVSAGAAG